MSEQIEDDFWAEERARDTAARGKHADPAGCGTCKASVAAGGQVKHDECAKRATLLPAPDAPDWELITGLSEEELAALPARFHVPAFIESSTPKAWVCAVCWGDGWSTRWPCKTALDQGLRVFTAEDYAETAAKRQAAELDDLRKEINQLRADLTAARTHVAELEAYALGCDAEGCTIPHSSWCEIGKKTAAENGGCTCPQPWKDSPQPHAAYCWLVSPPRAEVEEMRKKVAEVLAGGNAAALELGEAARKAIAAVEVERDQARRDSAHWQHELQLADQRITELRAATETGEGR